MASALEKASLWQAVWLGNSGTSYQDVEDGRVDTFWFPNCLWTTRSVTSWNLCPSPYWRGMLVGMAQAYNPTWKTGARGLKVQSQPKLYRQTLSWRKRIFFKKNWLSVCSWVSYQTSWIRCVSPFCDPHPSFAKTEAKTQRGCALVCLPCLQQALEGNQMLRGTEDRCVAIAGSVWPGGKAFLLAPPVS